MDEINRQTYAEFGNPETVARIAQYEMAFRMQLEASDAMDITREPASVLARYGAEPGKTSFANNCLVARRLAERGVRFIQLYHWGWDSHGTPVDQGLNVGLVDCCQATDQPTAALLADLKERGLLEDTLIVWGGEFGRTPMQENPRRPGDASISAATIIPRPFPSGWRAAASSRASATAPPTIWAMTWCSDPVEVRDLHATMLYLLGFDYRNLQLSLSGPRPEADRGQTGAHRLGNPGMRL